MSALVIVHLPEATPIDRLETQMVQFPPVEIEPVHRFADGIYAREITIPKGTALTGKRHLSKHIVVISKGDLTIWSMDEGRVRVQAPHTFVSMPGAQRAIYAHEDSVMTCIHGTAETDLEKLETLLIEPHDNPLLSEGAPPWLG